MKVSMCRLLPAVPGILLVLLLSSLAAVGQECVVNLLPGAPLQEAVDSVQSGGVICLSPGDYTGPLTISKSLTLRGSGENSDQVRIIGTNQQTTTILVRSSEHLDLSLENLSVEGNSTSVLVVEADASIVLDRVHIAKAMGGSGLLMIAPGSITAADCLFSGCTSPTIRDLDTCNIEPSNGVAISAPCRAVFERCAFRGNGTGANVADECDVDFRDCEFTDNRRYGLFAGHAVKVRAERCVISRNKCAGFSSFSGPGFIEFSDCIFADNIGNAIHAGWLGETPSSNPFSTVLTMRGCQILRNGGGVILMGRAEMIAADVETSGSGSSAIYAEGSAKLELTRCRIMANGGSGLDLTGASRLACADCLIADNKGDGLYLEEKALLDVRDTKILRNVGRGIALAGRECTPWVAPSHWFAGEVTGDGNVIPGRFVTDGNGQGSICPGSLEFLRDY